MYASTGASEADHTVAQRAPAPLLVEVDDRDLGELRGQRLARRRGCASVLALSATVIRNG